MIRSEYMIYVTGDCHGDWRKFSTKSFPEQRKMTKDDYVIVCGDFGLWHDTNEERYWLDWLNNKSFTTLFVGGNHENYDRLLNSDEFEEVEWNGGVVKKIRNTILYLENGYVFNINGKKFFVFGGAKSHDINDGILDLDNYENHLEFSREYNRMVKERKAFRVNHLEWRKEEIPSKEDMNFAENTLSSNDNKVDYILTHCAPQTIVNKLFNMYESDELTEWLDKININTNFGKWFFGHYHENLSYINKYFLLYNNIMRIE